MSLVEGPLEASGGRAMTNPNELLFEEQYRSRRLGLPVRLNFEIQSKLAMFRRLVQPLQPITTPFSVLDIGFGYGHMLFTLPTRCRLLGIDVTTTAVERAKARASADRYAGYDFVRLDIDDTPLPWPAHSVDLLICSHVLEHVRNDARVVDEIARVVRPGGHVIAMVPINETDETTHPLHVRRYSTATFRHLLESRGFTIVREDLADSYHQLLEHIGRRRLPRVFNILRGKVVGLLGAVAVVLPALQSLSLWGAPRDYGVLGRRQA